MLSRRTGYGVLALGCVEASSEDQVLAKDIAASCGIPLPFLSQILRALGQAGLVHSKRGYRGGVSLARSADSITLLEVVEALEGPDWFPPCLLGLDECTDHLAACPTHDFWVEERERIEALLRGITVADTAKVSRQRFLEPHASTGMGDGI